MVKAINPNLLQTIEGQPVLVHAGPFANIAIGQSSIIADRVALKLADYHVTESGFAADIGFEKFWNLKCRFSGLTPNCSVLVVHGARAEDARRRAEGGAGQGAGQGVHEKNVALVEKGLENLLAHIETIKQSGIDPVVCINHFYTDTDDGDRRRAQSLPSRPGRGSPLSKHWEKGGEGARELAEAVVDACNQKSKFKFLYELSTPLRGADRADRHEGLRRGRGVLHAAGPGEGQRIEADPGAVEAGHLHGEDPPVPLPRSRRSRAGRRDGRFPSATS